jgi:nucleoside-diphosphate-sugar epimerase
VLEAMAAESVRHFVFSSTCATYGEPIETPIAETHPQQPINSYGETKLAVERALPHFERALRHPWVALRYFNAAGADPDGEIGEDHSPEIHLIPRAIEAATGGAACRCSATTIRRRTAPACATTCTSPISPTRTSARSSDRRDRQVGRYNLGTGRRIRCAR